MNTKAILSSACLGLAALGMLLPACRSSEDEDSEGSEAAATDGRAVPSCHEKAPPGAKLPPPLEPYDACPTLDAASGTVELRGWRNRGRRFLVVKPKEARADEALPVVFLWHWLGGKPETAKAVFDVERAVEDRRFIAVLPYPKGDSLWRWPFSLTDSDLRADEEATFFEDMLYCVSAQISNVALHCVSTMGVSAGALFSAQLAARQSHRLSSMVSLSGGVGGLVKGMWPKPKRAVPSLVLWGGPSDRFVVDFDASSKRLEDELGKGAIVECVHNCGHAIPPFLDAGGKVSMDPLWRFVFDHPYGLAAGATPYAEGMPESFPSWCAVGKGRASIRSESTGSCPKIEKPTSNGTATPSPEDERALRDDKQTGARTPTQGGGA